jgi:hypothetical protein
MPMALRESNWQAPPYYDPRTGDRPPDDRLRGWLREAIEQGYNHQKSQRAYPFLDKSIELLSGIDEDPMPKSLSDVKVNRIRRNIRESVATLSNLRPGWGYKNDNHSYDDQATLLTRLFRSWWSSGKPPQAIKQALQWAAVGGIAYLNPVWQVDMHGYGRGDIALNVYGPREVLFVQLPRDHNLQRAYAVIIIVETPIAIAHAMYPEFADKLEPSRDRPRNMRAAQSRVQRFLSPVMNWFGPGGRGREEEEVMWPVVDIAHAYVLDTTINMTAKSIMMGEPGTSWEYEVPSYGSDTPSGINDPNTHQMLMRKVTREEAMLFPMRRKVITALDSGGDPQVTLYDGTAHNWHRQVPLVPITLDQWPWEQLPFGLAHDAWSIQKSNDRILRAIDDSINANLRPKLLYDESLVAKSVMDQIDMRSADGMNIPANFQMGEVMKPLIDPSKLQVPAGAYQHLETMYKHMDYLMGVNDLTALAKAKQIPASDSIEKIREMAGPLVSDMSHGIEINTLTPLGEMMKSMFFQWYNAPRRMQLLGVDGVTEEDWDFKPGDLIPSHLPGEDTQQPSRLPMWQRAKWHQNNFYFRVVPHSAHQITQTGNQLKVLQLIKAGIPINPWWLCEMFDIDFGPRPEGEPENNISLWMAWTEMQAAFKAKMMEQFGGGQPEKGQKGGGRPPSNQKPPQLVQKDGGARSIVKTS